MYAFCPVILSFTISDFSLARQWKQNKNKLRPISSAPYQDHDIFLTLLLLKAESSLQSMTYNCITTHSQYRIHFQVKKSLFTSLTKTGFHAYLITTGISFPTDISCLLTHVFASFIKFLLFLLMLHAFSVAILYSQTTLSSIRSRHTLATLFKLFLICKHLITLFCIFFCFPIGFLLFYFILFFYFLFYCPPTFLGVGGGGRQDAGYYLFFPILQIKKSQH